MIAARGLSYTQRESYQLSSQVLIEHANFFHTFLVIVAEKRKVFLSLGITFKILSTYEGKERKKWVRKKAMEQFSRSIARISKGVTV